MGNTNAFSMDVLLWNGRGHGCTTGTELTNSPEVEKQLPLQLLCSRRLSWCLPSAVEKAVKDTGLRDAGLLVIDTFIRW